MVLTTHSVVTPRLQIHLPPPPLCCCWGRSWSGLTFTALIFVIAARGVKRVCVVIGSCRAVVHSAVLNCLWPFQVILIIIIIIIIVIIYCNWVVPVGPHVFYMLYVNILYVIGCKNIHTVLLKLYNQFYMNILYEIVCKNVHTFMKKIILTPPVFLIFLRFLKEYFISLIA